MPKPILMKPYNGIIHLQQEYWCKKYNKPCGSNTCLNERLEPQMENENLTEYDIKANIQKLLDSFNENEDITEDLILSKKDLIKEIADECRKTKLFKSSKGRYDEAMLEFKGKPNKIVVSYLWFLNRIVAAPTTFHMIYSGYLTLPMVDDLIQEKLSQIDCDKTVT